MRSLIAAIGAALLLTGCDKAPATLDPPSPALWEVANPAGEREGWLFGTIHSLPDGIEWNTAALEEAVDGSGVLVVEVAGLEDDAATAAIFSRLAQSPGHPPLTRRVSPSSHRPLIALLDAQDRGDDEFASIETWAAALMLAQGMSGGDPANGADRALIRRFAGRAVLEFEGAEAQLGIFDSLPEGEQRDLLEAVIAEGDRPDRAEQMAQAWLRGDLAAIEAEARSGLLADRELRAALLTARNHRWIGQLESFMQEHPPLLVAVGTAHLVGPEGLPALLETRGYKLRRVQ